MIPVKVKMKFNENKFYNDLNNPMFYKDEEYTIEGAAHIERWMKRGGVILEVLETEDQSGKKNTETYREHMAKWESKEDKAVAAKDEKKETVVEPESAVVEEETEADKKHSKNKNKNKHK